MQGLIPEITFADQELLLLTPQISSVPEKHLKSPIGSLAHAREPIVKALDLAITGIECPQHARLCNGGEAAMKKPSLCLRIVQHFLQSTWILYFPNLQKS